MLRKGHELGSRRPDWRYPSAVWVAQAERILALAKWFPALLRGEDKPKDNAERMAFAQEAYDGKHFAAATRLYVDAFVADPKLADGVHPGNRYSAARVAALAGSGRGKDAPHKEAERARYRGLALDWLRDHLAFNAKHLAASTPTARADMQGWLQHWLVDPDLASIRDAEALAKLPETEQKEWQALWTDVKALMKRASGTGR